MGKMDRMVSDFRYANRTNQTLYKTLLFGYKNCQRETRDVKANKEKLQNQIKTLKESEKVLQKDKNL